MSDLISRLSLKDRASEYALSADEYKRLCKIIDTEPTAYSVDNVVEELLALNKNYNDGINLYEEVAEIPTEEAIEIVKQGGISDDTDNMCEWKKLPFSWFAGCDGCKVEYKQGDYCPRCGKKIKIKAVEQMGEEDYCYCHYHDDTYEYFDCLDYMECEECPYYYADEDQVVK